MNRVEAYIRQMRNEGKPVCAYLYDLGELRRHARRRVESLPDRARLYYAVKANSAEAIIRALAPIVHGFEVASLGEIRKVRAISRDMPILFGGPGKTDEELVGAIEHRVSLIHVESLHELQRVACFARQKGVVVPILLRVNLRGPFPQATLAMAGRPTQFGIDEAVIPKAIRLAVSLGGVKLEGFHFHSLSNHLDAANHAQLVSYYLDKVKAWSREYGLSLSCVNAGGGIGVNYADLASQFDWNVFTGRLADVLDRECPPGVQVLFECGRYVTASCGCYAAEVLDIKQNHGKTYAVIRGGTHHFRLPASWQHSHPFTVIPAERWPYPFERTEWRDCEVTVVGQLCTPKDVLATDVFVPRLRIGDVLCFRYAGAYGWAISHHDFLSHPHPAHIYLDETET